MKTAKTALHVPGKGSRVKVCDDRKLTDCHCEDEMGLGADGFRQADSSIHAA